MLYPQVTEIIPPWREVAIASHAPARFEPGRPQRGTRREFARSRDGASLVAPSGRFASDRIDVREWQWM